MGFIMLNDNTLKMLNIFGNECQGLGYKVFSFSELVAFFPKENYVDEQTVKENIELLAKHGFISVKHLDQEQVCLSLLDKGRQSVELNPQIKSVADKKIMISAFYGTLLGSGVVGLIFAILFFILGAR